MNNMCRIRALEARTRSSAGEKVVDVDVEETVSPVGGWVIGKDDR